MNKPVTGDKVIDRPHTCEWCRWVARYDTRFICEKEELSFYGSDNEYKFRPEKDFGCIFWAGKDDQKGA